MTQSQTLLIDGMHCQSCVGRITKALESLDGVESAIVDLESKKASLQLNGSVPQESIEQAISNAGSYQVIKNIAQSNEEQEASFRPLIIIVGYVLLGTLIAGLGTGKIEVMFLMRVFMGLFFIIFSLFKMLDVRGFAESYAMYDVVAGRWKLWGMLYPFVELGLGVSYLLYGHMDWVHWLTILILGVSSVGVIKAVTNKTKIRCACLGTGFNLPMTTVTIIEDVGMVAMAIIMLIL